MIAEILGFPALTFARKATFDGTSIRIERQTAAGYDVVESPLPALVSVTSAAVEPRYPTFKGIMQAKQKPVDQPTAADLGFGGRHRGTRLRSDHHLGSSRPGTLRRSEGERRR